MAGVVGFEPTIHGTKNRCLTTWLHPNGERLSTIVAVGVQELFGKKMWRPEKFLAGSFGGNQNCSDTVPILNHVMSGSAVF